MSGNSPRTNGGLRKQEKELTRIWVGVLSSLVTRYGRWVAHPEMGGFGWSVTLAASGLRAATFSTRGRAEQFAREISEMVPTIRTLEQWMKVPTAVRKKLSRRIEEIREGP